MNLRNQNMEDYNTDAEGLEAVNLLLSSLYPVKSVADMVTSKILQNLKNKILDKMGADDAEWSSIAN